MVAAMAEEKPSAADSQGNLLYSMQESQRTYGNKLDTIRDLIDDDPERAAAVIKLWLEELQSNDRDNYT